MTAPTEARLEPDWETSLAIMLEKQPDIVRQRSVMKRAESDASGPDLARIERQNAYLKQLTHQTTHSLARFFLEIDSNYKQLQTAHRSRAAAALRLESQRAYYEERRITIDRFLDAVSQYATLVAAEAQYKTTYNISIVALEEAKGTLLEYEKIEVAEGPKVLASPGVSELRALTQLDMSRAPRKTQDGGVRRTSVEPQPAQGPPVALPAFPPGAPTPATPEEAKKPNAAAAGKTVAFQFTIGTGSRPIEIRGSFTITPAPAVEGTKTP